MSIRAKQSDAQRDPGPGSVANHFGYADGFRAIAILGVVVVHAVESASPQFFIFHVDVARAAAYLGTFGVAMLFVLSGFLLAPPFIAALLDETQPKPNVTRYFYKRFLRIYPLYVVAVLAFAAYHIIYGLITGGHNSISSWDIAAHLFFLHDFSTATAESIDGPLWTMPVDVQFYIALPLFFAALYTATAHISVRRRAIVLRAVLVAIVLGSIAYRAVIVHFHPASVDRFIDQVVWIKTLLGMSAAFALGILVAIELQTTFAGSTHRRAGAIAVVTGVLLALCHAWTRRDVPHTHSAGFIFGFAAYDAIAALAAAMILFGFAIGRFKTMDHSYWELAGLLAYAVYVIHQPIIVGLAAIIHVSSNTLAFTLQLWGCAAVLSLLAPLAYRFVERPFLRMKSRLNVPTRAEQPTSG